MLTDQGTESPPPLAEGVRPVPADEFPDTGTALCPDLPSDLRYVDDSGPGITRRKLRGKFAYFLPSGERINDSAEISRINKLAIPPAYSDVWICPDPQGHMQATGRDARGRKQYRYHPRWREVRDCSKYDRVIAFGAALPKMRERLEEHLAVRGMPREKVMALLVQLLESTLIRVGNSRYAKENRSYGLTTLRTRHVDVRGSAIRFHFRGKSGVEHRVTLKNQRLARMVRRCMEIPGQHLFQYLDEDGARHPVSSSDVNQFIQQMTGGDFTAKDYRTWAGSALALDSLRKREWQPDAVARRNLVETVKDVSQQLGNTPAVCRQCYIHPEVLEAFTSGELARLPKARKRKWMSSEEVTLLNFLKARCAAANDR
ncbi:DNA topoisomerase IB [Stutzerimonas zhaodongensis]|uniref:DNA topoisomerase IB n=1 Tax=Stutzerimonas zhaodongensis TaxID=1176257 RepID=UPI0039F11376